jgi:hypothetical protein
LAVVFEEDDLVCLLRAAVEREGGQSAREANGFAFVPHTRCFVGSGRWASKVRKRVMAFLRPVLRIALSLWKKEGPNTHSNVSRPKWRAFVFC